MRSVKSVGISLVAFALLAFVASPLARAADDKGIDGTWKFAMQGGRGGGGGQGGNGGQGGQGGQRPAREVTLKLKHDGDKLTGDVTRPGRQGAEPVVTKIEDGTFKNGEVAFSVTNEFNGNKFTTKYKGKLEGDTITGTVETERNGQTQSRDWKATRAKDEDKKPDEKKPA
jgi:hypothetical protein